MEPNTTLLDKLLQLIANNNNKTSLHEDCFDIVVNSSGSQRGGVVQVYHSSGRFGFVYFKNIRIGRLSESELAMFEAEYRDQQEKAYAEEQRIALEHFYKL